MKQVVVIGLAACLSALWGCSSTQSAREPVLIEPGYSYLRHGTKLEPMTAAPAPITDARRQRMEMVFR